MDNVKSFVRFCESEFGTTVMDREADYVSQHIDEGDRVLDVGCGIGSLEERFDAFDVIGMDRSMAMVQTASERAPARFVSGDARFLPIGTDSIDVVVSVATLEFIQDIESVLAEAVRVLAPDGTFIALLLNTESSYVRSNLKREGSYFQKMVHRDTGELLERTCRYIEGQTEYLLGIEDETVFESRDPETAAITAVVGTPAKQVETTH